MIRYNKLFALLAENKMKKTDLLKVISSPTLAKLSKDEVVRTDIIDKICLFLHCQPENIMEVVTERDVIDRNTGKKMKLITKNILEPDYDGAPVKEQYLDFLDGFPEELIARSDWHKPGQT